MSNGVRQTAAGVVESAGGTAQTVVDNDTVIDSWEDSDKTEYTGGDGGYTISTANPSDGSVHIRDTAYAQLFSYPGDGLPQYISRGEAFAYDFYVGDPANSACGVYFGAVNDSNAYFTRVQNGNEMEFVKKVGGTNTALASNMNITVPSNTYLRFEVRWDDGTQGGATGDMTGDLYDTSDGSLIGSVSASSTAVEDNTGSNGEGVGWWKSGASQDDQDWLRKLTW